MNNNFNTIENKRLLWQMLYENKIFDNIPNHQIENIKNIFENQINILENNDNSSNLTEKNKKLIKIIIQSINVFKTTNNLKPLQEVEIKISQDFNNKKEEMIELLKKPTQEEINFNEGIDNPINNEEMDSILNEMIKNRNLDILEKEKKVNFNIDNNKPDNNKPDNNLFFLDKLKKQDNIDIENNNIEKNNIENNNIENNNIENNNIKNNNINIINMLERILDQQEEILNILKK